MPKIVLQAKNSGGNVVSLKLVSCDKAPGKRNYNANKESRSGPAQ